MRPFFILALLGCILAFGACSRGSGIFDAGNVPGIEVKLRLEGQNAEATSPTLALYAPGDMIIAVVEVTNRLGKKAIFLTPHAAARRMESTVNFAVKTVEGDDVLRRVPVVPRIKSVPERLELGPGETFRRPFFFTDLTRRPGSYLLQVAYSATLKGGAPQTFYSEPVQFRVEGKRRWNRTVDGILAKQDAIDLAVRHFGKPVQRSEARLVENAAGLLDWQVTITPETGNPNILFISPYGAFVRSETAEKRADPSLAPPAPSAKQP